MSEQRHTSGARRVVARFPEPVMAHMAKARLEEEGIPAFVRDAHTIGIQWLYSIALGGVRVEVDEQDEERAKELLQTDFSEQLTEEQWSGHAHPDLRCPRCGSDDVVRSGLSPRTGLMSLLKWTPFSSSRRKLTCRTCGRIWTQ
jgi:hypothetical protein